MIKTLIIFIISYSTYFNYFQTNKNLPLYSKKQDNYYQQSNSTSSKQSKKKIYVGEDLTYVVKYLFIPIGEIRLKVLSYNEKTSIYSTIAYMNSYKGIPFVNLHQIYESKFDKNQTPIYFNGTILESDTTYTIYNFDYKKKLIYIKKGSITKNEVWTDSTAVLDKEYQDGLSIFYFARMRTGKRASYEVPIFIKEMFEKITINFYDKPESITINSVDFPIESVYLNGRATFTGIFGLTGDFEGWFSNDDRAIPLRAKLRVIIGNITVELKNWNNLKWEPPRYQN